MGKGSHTSCPSALTFTSEAGAVVVAQQVAGACGGIAVAQTRNAQKQGEQGKELHVALQADEEARISACANWTYSGC